MLPSCCSHPDYCHDSGADGYMIIRGSRAHVRRNPTGGPCNSNEPSRRIVVGTSEDARGRPEAVEAERGCNQR